MASDKANTASFWRLAGQAATGVLDQMASSVANVVIPLPKDVPLPEAAVIAVVNKLVRNDRDEAYASAERMIKKLTPDEKANVARRLMASNFLLDKVVPLKSLVQPNLRLAQFLWRTLGLRFNSFVQTLQHLNYGKILAEPDIPGRQFLAEAEARESIQQLRAHVARQQAMYGIRDAWLNLLAEQGLAINPNVPNADIYDYVYNKRGGYHAEHWLVEKYGNFPIGVDQSTGTLIRLLDKWPDNDPALVAFYGMYPSLDSERERVAEIIDRTRKKSEASLTRLITNVFGYLANLGANRYNIQRILDLHITPRDPVHPTRKELVDTRITRDELLSAQDDIIDYGLAYANLAVLEAVEFEPMAVNIRDSQDVERVAQHLANEERRDMWEHLLLRKDASVVIPRALQIVGATEL